MKFKHYLRALNGLLYGVDEKGDRHAVNDKEMVIMKSGDNEFVKTEDDGLIEIKIEERVKIDMKEPSTVERGFAQIQDMVLASARSSAETRNLANAVSELVKMSSKNTWNRRGQFEADVDVLTNQSADEITKAVVPGAKIYRDQFGRLQEEAPSDPVSAKLFEFQKRADQVHLVAAVKKRPAGVSYNDHVKSLATYKLFAQWAQASGLGKAISTSATGGGTEWIPTGYSPRLFERVRLMLQVANLFETIPMTTKTLVPPVQTVDATAYLIPENAADEGTKITASRPTTANFTLTAKKIAARVVVSDEADEDSIVSMQAFLERNLAQAIANGIENALIDGDTTATHQDSNITSALDVAKAWKGMRKLASDKSATISFSNAKPTVTLMRTVLATMGSPYAIKTSDLAWIISPTSYLLLLSEMITKDNSALIRLLPGGASIIPGQIMEILGIPVVVSEYQYSNLNASGVYDGSTTDRSLMNLVYRPGFIMGMRTSGVQINRIVDVETDQSKIVAKQRADFADVYGSSYKTVASGYNIDEA